MNVPRLWLLAYAFWGCTQMASADEKPIRFATFNVAMNRPEAGQLVRDLETKDNPQALQIAEIIQRVRPDVILLNEFDLDASHKAADLFQRHYLEVSQNNQEPIKFAYRFLAAVNTGVASDHDLDNDGETDGPGDAFGFGEFSGQFGMLVLSKLPIDMDKARTFQKFLWRDMPNALLPETDGVPYFSAAETEILRLSSKSHWDLPIDVGDGAIHFLCAHPTPPVFDGPEDRNGRRNHDEIRFWADYIDPARSGSVYDDRGARGGLAAGSHFIIVGDMNADPSDGDSHDRAIEQLLTHALINSQLIPTSRGASEKSARDQGANLQHEGPAEQDTSDFGDANVGNLRLDYALTSTSLEPSKTGVFWPDSAAPGHALVEASDHRLVWVDVRLPQ